MYNQYEPYGNFYQSPYQNLNLQNGKSSFFQKGILSGIQKPKFNWNQFLNNTQRTLGIINQAIPIVYQVKPILTNAKTMLKIATAMGDGPSTNQMMETTVNEKMERQEQSENAPQFFI